MRMLYGLFFFFTEDFVIANSGTVLLCIAAYLGCEGFPLPLGYICSVPDVDGC